jgi:hypothetical protein
VARLPWCTAESVRLHATTDIINEASSPFFLPSLFR